MFLALKPAVLVMTWWWQMVAISDSLVKNSEKFKPLNPIHGSDGNIFDNKCEFF
jgi:hypothetical protein